VVRACYAPDVADSNEPDEIVTLARVGDVTTAQLLCGRLDADGIECVLPDQHLALQLTPAIRGVRVQVRRADLERAQEILAEPGIPDLLQFEATDGPASEAGSSDGGVDGEDTIGPGDRAAFRALRVTLVSLWLMGLVHPYSLWLAVRALRRADITDWGRRRAGIALLISAAGCVWLVMLVRHLIRLGG
jgi:hypothetical protein